MKSAANSQLRSVNSMASAYQFNPEDPRYFECCCCARLHVSTVAKAAALICIFSNVISIWSVLMHGTSLPTVIWLLFGSGVMAVAVFQEHRPTLILLLVLQGLTIALAALLLIILFVSTVFGYGKTSGLPKAEEIRPLVYVIVAFTVGLIFWSFAVMLHFFAFLTDRERAGAVHVMYESRHPLPAQNASAKEPCPSRSYDPRKRPSDAHPIAYPIVPVQRTPSLTPAPSPIPPSAVPVVIEPERKSIELAPPPPYKGYSEDNDSGN